MNALLFTILATMPAYAPQPITLYVHDSAGRTHTVTGSYSSFVFSGSGVVIDVAVAAPGCLPPDAIFRNGFE